MVHYVAPKVAPNVYLQAKTQNTSPYPLLPSNKVSVFLDGNFISKSTLPQSSSGEFFTVFLGVDPSVKVEYMPCQNSQRTKGWITGMDVRTYQYATVLHNTKKQHAVHIILAEILPRSTEEKVVVELLEPSASTLSKPSDTNAPIATERELLSNLDLFTSAPATGAINVNNATNNPAENPAVAISPTWPKDFITQNKFTNNIVWFKTLGPGEKIQVKYKFKITWPQGMSITRF